jgi:hypothetical protein
MYPKKEIFILRSFVGQLVFVVGKLEDLRKLENAMFGRSNRQEKVNVIKFSFYIVILFSLF